MYYKRVTITTKIKVFEEGEIVVPSSWRSSLDRGFRYKVTDYIEPTDPLASSGTVFVEGHEYGIEADYLMNPDEDYGNDWPLYTREEE